MTVKNFFTKDEQDLITKSISEAEKNTSGEIRVHIEMHCKTDPKTRAIEVFKQLKMGQTNLRNGVLFYFAVKDKKFAVIGDSGINEIVQVNFWNSIRDEAIQNFKQGKFSEGLITGITMTGEKLKAYFPYQINDKNELSNDISFEE